MATKKGFAIISYLFYISLFVVACGTNTPQPTETQPPIANVNPTATAVEVTPTERTITCADLDANWGVDWPAVLETLDQLMAADRSCGDEPLLSKKYAVHFNYASGLENEGELETAIEQYRAALMIDSQRKEALDALFRLKALPPPTPANCLSDVSPRPDPAPATSPDPSQFVTVEGDQLQLNGQPFKVKGVNYYPRRAPWQRFLTEADPVEMVEELDLIQQAGLNTLRIFLWNEPLFTCQPEDAIPNEAAFARLDQVLQLANERNLKVIVALNDLPDLTFRPLYTDYAHYDNQTTYIVRRYRNEPAILAWDLRNEGDLDHGAMSIEDARFKEEEVIGWLAHLSQLIRDNDPYHLVTAGWWGDPLSTNPHVDFLSFHHWTDANQLQTRINEYRRATDKPLLLEQIGYTTQAASPAEQQEKQKEVADLLSHGLRVAEAQNIAGWVIWTAFDFEPEPGQPENAEHFFGLWGTDLTPKAALETLPLP